MQNQRDSTIMDAWRNGGQFRGAPVTDDVVLAYWQDRLKGVSSKDPLYDQYKNNVLQLQYTIEESKARTIYEQTVGSNSAAANNKMADFYTSWLSKVPADSSFYRTLQQSAARFVQAAKSAAKSGGARVASSARDTANKATYDKYETAGAYLTGLLTATAKGSSIIQLDKNLITGVSGGGAVTDADKLQAIIRNINNNPGDFIPNIFDANGRRVTGQQVLDQLRKYDPSFSGSLTSDYYAQVLRQQTQGQQIRLADAMKNGTKTEVNDIIKAMDATNEAARQASVWDTSQLYAAARGEFERVAGSNASPAEKYAAWTKYQSALIGLATNPDNPVDDITRGKLIGEANLDSSTPTFGEAFIGTEAAVDNPKENAETMVGVRYAADQVQAVASGQAAWAFGGPSGKDPNGDPTGGTIRSGSGQIVAVSWSDIRSSGAQMGVYAQSDGSVVPIFIAPQTVKVTARDQYNNNASSGTQMTQTKTVNGQTVTTASFQPTGNDQVAKVFTYVDGGKTTQIYAYLDGNGVTRYTLEKPWSDNVVERVNPTTGEITLDVTAAIQAEIASGKQGGAVIWERNPDGTPTGKMLGYNVGIVWDETRALAGPNDAFDFYSLVTASVVAAQGAKVSQIADSPQYQEILRADAANLAASTQKIVSPITGQVLATPDEKYNEVIAQFNRAVGRGLGYENDALLIGRAYSPYDSTAAFMTANGFAIKAPAPKIVTQSPEFSSLSDYLNSQVDQSESIRGIAIKRPSTLIVPNMPEAVPAPAPTPTPTLAQTPIRDPWAPGAPGPAPLVPLPTYSPTPSGDITQFNSAPSSPPLTQMDPWGNIA